MTQYIEIKAALHSFENNGRNMNSNLLAVFAASLHCIGEVKVLSREIPRSRMPAADKGEERRGISTTVRHARFMG